VQLILTCLLYFTAYGAILALFASVVSIVVWLSKTLLWWLIFEPETDASRSKQFRPEDLAHLKRAGQ
jgi:hypothetical protein